MAIESRPAQRPWSAPSPRLRPTSEPPRLRVLWLLVIAVTLAATIWARLAYWQVAEHGYLSGLAASQHVTTIPLPATRGVLYDRDLRPLAINTTVYNVTVSPDLVAPAERPAVAAALATVLGVPSEQVLATLASDRKFAYIAKRQPQDRADQLRKLRLPGIDLQPEDQRTYLQGGAPDVSLASSLLGFVDYQGQGQRGVESYYNDRLAGRVGVASTYRDLLGREIVLGTQKRRAPVNGADLQLTLDSNIQYAAEQAIADGVKGAKAESGSILVMDPRTGGIVAWADYPGYDGNKFNSTDPGRTRDPIVSDVYEPGSVMKVVTLAGALDQGKITPATTINDPGVINVAGSVIHDWDLKNHGTVTMTNVLEKSLNVGAIRAMQAEGRDAYFNYLNEFGLAAPSSVDVADEGFQPLRPPARWADVDVATAAFGQGIGVNMVQMTAALNVIANQGRYAPPHVVDRVGGQAPATLAAPQRQVVSPEAAAAMTQMMQSVVEKGSGHTARVQGFELNEAGKTGTSQMPEAGRYSTDHVWASYAGFLPATNPRFTMLVVVRKPNNGSFDHNEGYYVSAPIWKRMAEQMIMQWRITPSGDLAPAGALPSGTPG